MGWGNIYKRRVKVFAVALIIYFDYKALQQREKWANKLKIASLWEKAHERNAKRVLNLIVDLEGLWVKLGQYLSTRADVLPEAYTRLLKQLQDSLPPRSLKEVCKTIENELGKTMDDLFLYFDKVPLATASIAQVHRATLSDGQEVVVKVQHDGIKAIILEDLKNAKSIVDWIAWAEPQYNFHPMIDEWCNESPKELDFNHEAENTRKVSRNLHCNKRCDDSKPANHVDVLIPEVIQSTEKVLVLEYMDGVRLNDAESLQALGVDKQKLVEEITRAYAHQIYVDGFFNGDPHPGNFLVSKEPPHRPILLDFGLTKLLSSSLKQALAKMFLAAAEGDHVALLAAFAEMGLKFRLDVPEQAMEVTSVFFRSSTPANEALESMKMLSEQRLKNFKVIQEKMKLNEKEVKRFNPVDAFPSDIVIFGRVLNLLRGLSATMNVRIVYIDIMRPFAESVLQCNLNRQPALNPQWIYDTPIHSDVEAKLRQLLVELGNAEKILGIQVCAYKDGEVIIDTAAGVLGKYDPRPVQPDSLFSVFSATKGICAGLVHWLVDNGKLKFEDNIANIWPEFGSNGKDQIKVHHVLNHTSGLHSAMSDINQEDPFLMTNWDECLKRIAMSSPETAPGREQLYHYLSFGWLCGGIIERASGRRFQELLEEVFVRPLKIDGELYVGIPPGVESRLATLTIDMSDLTKLSNVGNRSDLPTTFQPQQMAQLATTLPAIFNSLYARRAIIPAANGHCSARALARYYAALAEGGKVPPPHHSSMPTLGSHPHIPKFPSQQTVKKQKSQKKTGLDDQGSADQSDLRFCFRIISPTKSYTLQAESALDQMDWIEKITGVIASLLSSQAPDRCLTASPMGSGHHRSASESSSFESSDFDPPAVEDHPSDRLISAHHDRPFRNSQQLRSAPKSEQPIATLRRVCGNDRCADCGAAEPDWASLNLGVLVCIECSGVHRNLGVHISKVRSLTLDVKVWEPSVIALFQSLGNTFANSVWEESLQARGAFQVNVSAASSYRSDKQQQLYISKPSHADPISTKEKFIHAKYADKSFVRRTKDGLTVAQMMWEAVRANDKKAVYRLIVSSEADVNALYKQVVSNSSLTLAKVMLLQELPYTDQSSTCLEMDLASPSERLIVGDFDGCSLLHLACQTADLGMLELLMQYGANVNASDSSGQTPLHWCITRGKAAFAKLLIARGADPHALDGESKTPYDLALGSNFDDVDVLNLLSDTNA